MTIVATPTGRIAPGSDAPELDVHVTTGSDDQLRLEDGTSITLVGDSLTISGPRRDVLVMANGNAVQRAHGSDVTVDLWAAREHLPFDASAVAAGAKDDAARLPRHAYAVESPVPAAGQPATVLVDAASGVVSGRVHWTTDGSDPLGPAASVVQLVRRDDRWTAEIPGQPDGTWLRYAIELGASDGTTALVADAAPAYLHALPNLPFHRPERSRFSYAVHSPEIPDWIDGAAVYHVLVDRFAGDGGCPVEHDGTPPLLGFLGGTIDGLISRLDYIASIGVGAVLVSCLTPCDMHVGYDALSTTGVEPRLGTEDDVRRLCDEAHRRGLRVLLDHEASYAGGRHPAVVEARRDPGSARADWFLRSPNDGRLLGWFGGNPTFVPFDHDHPEVRDELIAAAKWWLDLGIDGFRLDSAQNGSLDFWAAFGRAVRQHKAGAFTFGEITTSFEDAVRIRGRLDGFLDFGLQRAICDFAKGHIEPSALEAVVSRRAAIPPDVARVTLADGHDVDRLAHTLDGDRERVLLALGLLLTLPGVPLLYYGTEVGMSQPGPGDPDLMSRLPMQWGDAQDRELLAEIAAMVRRRMRSRALRTGVYASLPLEEGGSVFAFTRTEGGECVTVVANSGLEEATAFVPGHGVISIRPVSVTVLEGT